MNKVFVVFQDCWKCGRNKAWAEAQMDLADEKHIEIVPMSFVQKGAREYILTAADKGVKLPFFTDGKKYSRYLSDFVTSKREVKNGKVKKSV